ncbi:MAG: ABC transporter ATP-binding protein [Spirochaetaceae bacterium]|nr:ABC transporter ATP-binding protein [Spirochaetaceae bacterium]
MPNTETAGGPKAGPGPESRAEAADDSLLRMEGITKIFPGVVANDKISLDLRKGEILALVGENGAGKSTLMKILYGLYRPDSGDIFIGGKKARIAGPKDAIARGIGMVHQHFMLVPPFSVLENVVLGSETARFGVLRNEEPARKIAKLVEDNNLAVELDAVVEDLPVGLQQRVEILKVLYRGAEILIFDEPTAVLTPQEADELFKTFRQMRAQGKGIIFISHKLDEVLDIADRITVIRRGKVIKTLPRAEATKPLIAELMVGKPVLLNVDNPRIPAGETVLKVEGLCYADPDGHETLHEVGFEVRAGEIYGIAGVEGNGQSELVRSIAYRIPVKKGDIKLQGGAIQSLEVRERRERGVAHIPEDRHRYGLLLPYSLADNFVLGRHFKAPFVNKAAMQNRKEIADFAKRLIKDFDVRTPSELTPAHALSGGNQQKVIIAREMSSEPKLLLANQPTRGVDVGATEFIYKQLVEAKKRGAAVLLVSADLDEVMSLSDRIGVMYKGRIIKEFGRDETTKEEVGFFMMGEKSK